MPKEAFGIPYSELAKTGLAPETIGVDYHYQPLRKVSDLRTFFKASERDGFYQERTEGLESDETFGQLIMYGFHVRPDGKFFLYQRGGVGSYDEARLAGQVSVGIGGHMERADMSLARSFKRELAEEAYINDNGELIGFSNPDGSANIDAIRKSFRIEPRGLLRDGRRQIDKVHVGVVARLHLINPEHQLQIIENGENVASQYVSLEDYYNLVDLGRVEPEMWTDAVVREEIAPLFTQ